jgi:hypothetical protein
MKLNDFETRNWQDPTLVTNGNLRSIYNMILEHYQYCKMVFLSNKWAFIWDIFHLGIPQLVMWYKVRLNFKQDQKSSLIWCRVYDKVSKIYRKSWCHCRGLTLSTALFKTYYMLCKNTLFFKKFNIWVLKIITHKYFHFFLFLVLKLYINQHARVNKLSKHRDMIL